MNVQSILGLKGSAVATVGQRATLADAAAQLRDNKVGALVVSDDGRHIDGIVSERDVVRRLNRGADMLDSPVSEIMSSEVRTCDGHDTVDEVMALMTAGRFRHVPVVKDGRLAGIVSIGDVVKSRMSELEFERDQLDSYVHGT